MKRTLTLLALGGLVVIAILMWWAAPEPPPVHAVAPETLRQTDSGPVLGYVEDGGNGATHAWAGIPFAAPPVGALRWAAPRPPRPWQAPLQTTAFASPCVQLWGFLSGVPGEEGDVVGSEDCLYLNVWTPAAHSSAGALPVMLWIHGGGNTVGSANTYNGARLASEQNLVVVTINYRLGLLGWLSHPALGGADRSALDASGNYGTLDIIAALQWVQRNIANFGGDPGRVTIFGESAGGRNVFSMMLSPLAAGLFQGAIAQSGTPATTPRWRAENFHDDPRPGEPHSSNDWLARQLQRAGRAPNHKAAKAALVGNSGDGTAGHHIKTMDHAEAMDHAETLAFMRALSPPDMLHGIDPLMEGMYFAPQVIRDGTVIPDAPPYDLLADPARHNSVPLITGTNRDEMKLFMASNPEFIDLWLGLFPRVKDVARYNRESAWRSDLWKMVAVDEPAARITANGGAPVYAYRWDWDEGARSFLVDYSELLGAGHGLEVTWVFDDANGWVPGLYNDHNRPGRDTLARAMRDYWAAFARDGRPGRGGAGLPEWRAWGAGGDNLLLLDTDADGGIRMVNAPMTAALLKQRLAADTTIDGERRCAMYATMFLQQSPGDAFWDADEFATLGCGTLDPWRLGWTF